MSPRRRLVAVAATLLAIVLAVAGVARLRSTDEGLVAVPQDRPGPVLLVPGYGGGTVVLEQLAARLRSEGRTATVLRLPGDGTGDLGAQSDRVAVAADAALSAGAPSVDVVGFSTGGVVARLWASRGGAEQARRVVTLAAPHHGSELAGLAGVVLPDACPRACRELVPGSDLLALLNQGDETPDGPRWVSIWTEDDQVVTPPSSARLDGALDVVLQEVCPGRRVDHGALPADPVVTALVVGALAVPEPTRREIVRLARPAC